MLLRSVNAALEGFPTVWLFFIYFGVFQSSSGVFQIVEKPIWSISNIFFSFEGFENFLNGSRAALDRFVGFFLAFIGYYFSTNKDSFDLFDIFKACRLFKSSEKCFK